VTGVRIYLSDDHPIYRDGLVRAFRQRPDFQVIGESADGLTALDEVEQLQPDIAVLDVRLPGLSGIELVRSIKYAQLGTQVVLLSAFSDSEAVYEAIACGAAAYLHKGADRDQVCDTVAAVARGETRLPPVIQGRLLAAVRAHATNHETAFTGREHEILTLTAEGLSAPDIGRRLQLSPATVKSHLLHVYEKLGVSDRAAAVAEAMRRGLLR
jgi:two-component system nitrate/nitrite response regulator NarL